MEIPPPPPPSRSSFVTVLAIVFIVLSAGYSLVGLMQNLMVNFMFPMDQMDQAIASDPQGLPAPLVFLFSHMRLFFLGMLLLSLTMLAASIGLLKRKAWGRILFIGMMAMGIAWNVAGVVLQNYMASAMAANMPPPGAGVPDFSVMMGVMRVFGLLMALVFSGLFGWIIYRLLRPEVAAEFAP